MPNEISRDALKNLGPVRVTIPVSVAFSLEALQNGIAKLMQGFGCIPCCSGIDITLITEREFILSEELKVSAVSVLADPQPSPWRTITLSLPENHDIGYVKDLIATAASSHGHRLCCSGFDIAFQQAVGAVK